MPAVDDKESQEQARATAWLSRGLEALVADRPWMEGSFEGRPPDSHFDYDVVIVGSGYGASVAAAALAACVDAHGKPVRVCVLERGKEYLAGSFPSRMAELAGHVRFATPGAKKPSGTRDGLFDIRTSADAVALVANGLGGGSLINAGVMAMPHASVFLEARWPKELREESGLDAYALQLLTSLGARHTTDLPPKFSAMQALAGSFKAHVIPVTVANKAGVNAAGVALDKCVGCGDCATGCNHNAKNSLDLNLLRQAQQAGAKIYTGATVLRVQRPVAGAGAEAGWELLLNHTDGHLRERQAVPFLLRARRVILSAGTLGSTEILMRSQSDTLQFSPLLGRKFSANGDMIAAVHDVKSTVNAVANEATESSQRRIGPTITAMIDLRQGDSQTDLVIQDMAVPGPLRRLFEENITTGDVLNQLVAGDGTRHDGKPTRPDEAAVDSSAMQRSLLVAMIGRDGAEGELRLGSHPICDDADGLLTVHWPALRHDPRMDVHHNRLAQLAKVTLGGRVINNLMSRPLSEKMEKVFGRQRGPLLTVHPLGGCAMADTARSGVTDHLGRVFNAGEPSMTSTHDGLLVLDGSIVPCSLGINPALTISVLALRAVSKLKSEWQFKDTPPPERQNQASVRRPSFRTPPTIKQPQATTIELTEQMRGWVTLRTRTGAPLRCVLELTLTSEPVALKDLMAHQAGAKERRLIIAKGKDPAMGRLRILRCEPDSVSDRSGEGDVLLQAEVSGDLQVFAFKASSPWWRTLRAFWAWLRNRGLRDVATIIITHGLRVLRWLPPAGPQPSFLEYVLDLVRLSSRAGAVRLIEYKLKIGKVLPKKPGAPEIFDPMAFEHRSIEGAKHLTYARCASPWTQLMEMALETFPQMARSAGDAPRLALNPRYLARQAVPLFRVVQQQDHVAALADLLSFVLYAMRVVLQVHALSFRKPDVPSSRPAERLPGYLPGLPPPQIDWLAVGKPGDAPVHIRLARYHDALKLQAKGASGARPVVLIHGYSASGTTFAHPAVPHGLVQTLCSLGRDVWVLDLRSSAGMPTARGQWAFEKMAQYDIPIAIEHVLAVTQAKKVDVVAHCMGSAMLGMALLAFMDRHRHRDAKENTLHQKIGRLVMSQVGPVMVLSPANVLRAYLMRYVRQYLPLQDYEFSPKSQATVADQLLDRMLATLPLSPEEYRRENPWWPPGKATPWVGTRHRIDALYGKTFSLANVSDEVLDCIDDFFGPLNVETVSQVIHFARFKAITNRRGVNRFVIPLRLKKRLTFPMLAIHGEHNGLSDVATLAHLREVLSDAGIPSLNPDTEATQAAQKPQAMHELIQSVRDRLTDDEPSFMSWCIPNHGHQDCLIGKDAGENCRVIADFLSSQALTEEGA